MLQRIRNILGLLGKHVATYQEHLGSHWNKMEQRIKSILEVTRKMVQRSRNILEGSGRRHYNVTGTSLGLLDTDIATYQ